MTFTDPLMPEIPKIDGLTREDHVTYIASAVIGASNFVEYWEEQGFYPRKPIVTTRFPAQHIVFTNSARNIVGLSISNDPNSPINKSLGLWGVMRYEPSIQGFTPGKLQHIAYEVNPRRSIDEVRAELESKGTQFMTPILRYQDPNGAMLEQMFVACKVPYGPFVEVIRRGLGKNLERFQGFHSDQIDNLYEHYDRYSRELLRK